jgi:hypothetical protein
VLQLLQQQGRQPFCSLLEQVEGREFPSFLMLKPQEPRVGMETGREGGCAALRCAAAVVAVHGQRAASAGLPCGGCCAATLTLLDGMAPPSATFCRPAAGCRLKPCGASCMPARTSSVWCNTSFSSPRQVV